MKRLLLTFALLLVAAPTAAQDQMNFPPDEAWRFRNFTNPGSCVQCSVGMCGWWQNVPQASYLLYDTDEYGPAVYHGSNPSRVTAYCDRRNIPAYNVTGSTTYDWMKWASRNGRMCAIGCYSSHFQTLLWWNPDPADARPWKVKNNWMVTGTNSVRSFNEFSDSEFRRHHESSGKWVVILKAPPPPVKPKYISWWK